MIVKTILTTSGKKKIAIPTVLSEITLKMLMDTEEGVGGIPMIPELTQDVFDNITDIKQADEIKERILSLVHQINYTYDAKAVPSRIHISGKWIDVPKNISIEPAGAYMVCRDLIAEEINQHIAKYGEEKWKEYFRPSLKCCAMLLANYFYCKATGQLWEEQKAEEFVNEIYKIPITQCLPIANFFFVNFRKLSTTKQTFWQALKQTWKNALVRRRLKNSNSTTR